MLYLAMKQEVRQFCSVRHETCTLVVQHFETNIVGDQVVQSLPGNAGCPIQNPSLPRRPIPNALFPSWTLSRRFPNKAPSLSLSKPERGEAGLPWHLKTVTWCSMRANQGRGRAPGSECYRPLYSPLSAAGEPSVERECGLGFMPSLRAKGLLHPATYTLHPKLNPIKPNPLFPLKKVLTKSMTK